VNNTHPTTAEAKATPAIPIRNASAEDPDLAATTGSAIGSLVTPGMPTSWSLDAVMTSQSDCYFPGVMGSAPDQDGNRRVFPSRYSAPGPVSRAVEGRLNRCPLQVDEYVLHRLVWGLGAGVQPVADLGRLPSQYIVQRFGREVHVSSLGPLLFAPLQR
jgi:hypothetical protein